MSDFDATISVNLSLASPGITREGFGMPMVLSADATFPERVRYYSTYQAAVGSGKDFVEGSGTALALAALFRANPRPPKVAVGRLAHKPTMSWLLTPVAVNGAVYGLAIDGQHVTYTADSTATPTEIVTGLKAAVAALSAPPDVTTGGTATLTLTGNVAGAFHRVKVDNINLLGIAQTMSDAGGASGIADDMSAILNEKKDWYAIVNPYASQSINMALAAWVETNKKGYLADSQDSLNATQAAATSGTADFFQALETSGYTRTLPLYGNDNGEFKAACWGAVNLVKDPGSETWKFSFLPGTTTDVLTDTQKQNILDKHGNYYTDVGGRGSTTEGWTPSGEYYDTVRGADWQLSVMQTEGWRVLSSGLKTPYTDEGVAAVQGAIEGALLQGVARNFLRADPAPTVSFPKVADIDPNTRASRILPDGSFSAQLAGAIHFVQLSGVLTP